MNERNKGIFYGIVAIATLIVAIVGATLAYFTALAGSANNAVGLKSKVVSIQYFDGQEIVANELIPASYEVVKKSYLEPNLNRERCRDDQDVTDSDNIKGYQVCYVYGFSVKNEADAVDLSMNLKIGENQFTNLRYILYKVDTDENTGVETRTNYYESNDYASKDIIAQDEKGISYPIAMLDTNKSLSGYDTLNNPIPYSMAAQTQQDFELVIYLDETGEAQDEQGKTFAGTIEVQVGNGTQITGRMSGINLD